MYTKNPKPVLPVFLLKLDWIEKEEILLEGIPSS